MEAIALEAAAFVGVLVRHLLALPAGPLLAVGVALLVAPVLIGAAIVLVVAVLKVFYLAVWAWWRFAPASRLATAGGG